MSTAAVGVVLLSDFLIYIYLGRKNLSPCKLSQLTTHKYLSVNET
jgi:hypothetical protein